MNIMRPRRALEVCLVAVIVLFTLSSAYSQEQRRELFMFSGDCAFCHTSSSTALRDSQGNDLSIFHDWSSTMMANSFRDPVFRAKLESEQQRNPHLSAVIEDKCLTCHAPMARNQHLYQGKKQFGVEAAIGNELAEDGVSCTLCHQVQPDRLGGQSSFSGNFLIEDRREIYGPYHNVFENPMLNHVDYRPVYGSQVKESALCGSCHTLFTPYVDAKGEVIGEFPEQTPFLEWLNSSYAAEESAHSCQECHMPRIDEPVKITNRPPWLDSRQRPFWRHHFTGGNSFVLSMMKKHREQLDLIADDTDLTLTITRTKQRLQEEAATLTLDGAIIGSDQLQLTVIVKNKTGHKFPTGFPVRRAWLQLVVRNSAGAVFFNSGNWGTSGAIEALDRRYEPHHETITSEEQVQIYEAVMADSDQNPTFTLLRAAGYLKDNRLVPEGYADDGPMANFTQVVGKARLDSNFNRESGRQGTGTDTVHYNVAVDITQAPFEVSVKLLYQTLPPRFLEDLLADKTPATTVLDDFYKTMTNEPVVVASESLVVQ